MTFDFRMLGIEQVINKMNGNLEARHLVFKNVSSLEDLQMALDNDLSVHLKYLSFDNCFDQSLENVKLPDGLTSLHMGGWFDHSLDHVKLPAGLTSLYLGDSFNQSFENVKLPDLLTSLNMGWIFNYSIENAKLPDGLTVWYPYVM
jgi:hypothetical protein